MGDRRSCFRSVLTEKKTPSKRAVHTAQNPTSHLLQYCRVQWLLVIYCSLVDTRSLSILFSPGSPRARQQKKSPRTQTAVVCIVGTDAPPLCQLFIRHTSCVACFCLRAQMSRFHDERKGGDRRNQCLRRSSAIETCHTNILDIGCGRAHRRDCGAFIFE